MGMMIEAYFPEDFYSGRPLAFFGAHSEDGPWVRLCAAIPEGKNHWRAETPLTGYRFMKLGKDDAPNSPAP